MTLSIKAPEADDLARKIADCTGANITQAVIVALRKELKFVMKKQTGPAVLKQTEAMWRRTQNLPDIHHGTPEEIIGYDEAGLPT